MMWQDIIQDYVGLMYKLVGILTKSRHMSVVVFSLLVSHLIIGKI